MKNKWLVLIVAVLLLAAGIVVKAIAAPDITYGACEALKNRPESLYPPQTVMGQNDVTTTVDFWQDTGHRKWCVKIVGRWNPSPNNAYAKTWGDVSILKNGNTPYAHWSNSVLGQPGQTGYSQVLYQEFPMPQCSRGDFYKIEVRNYQWQTTVAGVRIAGSLENSWDQSVFPGIYCIYLAMVSREAAPPPPPQVCPVPWLLRQKNNGVISSIGFKPNGLEFDSKTMYVTYNVDVIHVWFGQSSSTPRNQSACLPSGSSIKLYDEASGDLSHDYSSSRCGFTIDSGDYHPNPIAFFRLIAYEPYGNSRCGAGFRIYDPAGAVAAYVAERDGGNVDELYAMFKPQYDALVNSGLTEEQALETMILENNIPADAFTILDQIDQ